VYRENFLYIAKTKSFNYNLYGTVVDQYAKEWQFSVPCMEEQNDGSRSK